MINRTSRMIESNRHIGSAFDDFLVEEGLFEEVSAGAKRRIAAWTKLNETKMPALYRSELAVLSQAFRELEASVPPPRVVNMGNAQAYRYAERSIQQAIVQKLARQISGIHSAIILNHAGLLQEQASLHRMLDEIQQDTAFLADAVASGNVTELHQRYLDAFWLEEHDDPNDPVQSTRRDQVPRAKIRAHLANNEADESNPSRMIDVTRSIHHGYSGYVHAASPQVMEMYDGNPPRWNLAGMVGTYFHADHTKDIYNYVFRAITSFATVADAFKKNRLFQELVALLRTFQTQRPN